MSPQRTCLGCRTTADQQDLVRFVVLGAEVVEGSAPRLPGRGAYLHPARSCLEVAIRRGALQRALKTSAAPSEQVLAGTGFR